MPLLHQAFDPPDPFPELDLLLQDIYNRDTDAFAYVVRRIAHFLVGHEIGHAYPDVAQAPFLEIISEVGLLQSDKVPSRWADWQLSEDYGSKANIYHCGDDVWRLVWPTRNNNLREELACDVFSIWVSIIAEAGALDEKLSAKHFHSILPAFAFRQLVSFLLDLHKYSEAFSKEEAATSPDDKGMVSSIDLDGHHPFWIVRQDAAIFHLDRIGDLFDPGWKSPELNIIRDIREALWSRIMREASIGSLTVVYQVIDPLDSGTDPDQARRMDGSPIGDARALSIFESLWWECVGPLAERTVKIDHPTWVEDLNSYVDTWVHTAPEFPTFFAQLEKAGTILSNRYE